MLTQNATWCQNRGCICISSVRRTYGRIHIPASTIILCTELFPKKRREKIQGEILQSSSSTSTVMFPHSTYKNYKISSNTVYSTVFPHAIQQLQVSTVNSTYRINSSPRNTTTIRLIPCHPVQISTRHLPATVSHVSKHSTQQNKAPGLPTAFQGHTAQAGFQLILPGRNSTPSGSQHPRSPYSFQARPTPQGSTWYYRILPGEIGFFPKGLSIVCPCNTKVSVFQFTCYKNINSIQSSSNSMRRYSTLSSIQVVLVAILHKLQ